MPDQEDSLIESRAAKEFAVVLANRIQPPLLKYDDFWSSPALGVSASNIELEPEQALCVQGIEQTLRAGHSRLYIEAPTGWGKTVMAMKLLELLRDGKKPAQTLIVANDIVDLWRWRDEFEKHQPVLGVPRVAAEKYIGVYYGDEKQLNDITITTYDSFVNMVREGLIGADSHEVVILDEGHRSLSDLRQETLGAMNAVQISLSATPAYTHEKSLEVGSVCAYSCSPQKAEELKLIAPYQQVVIVQPRVQLSDNLLLSTGKYNLAALGAEFKRAHVTQSFVNFYKTWQYGDGAQILGRQGIINCLSVDHADDVAKEINEIFKNEFSGFIPAIALNGNTPKPFRKWAVEEFKAGRVLMLCGDELFVHGFDAPNVDFVFNMSPSTSGVRVGQRGGRARRIDRTGNNPNKVAVIADILYENTSPRGWQLLYAEWMQSRLFEKGDKFFTFETDARSVRPSHQGASFDWRKVPPDTIIDSADKIENLIAWRERQWSELRPTALWTTRFPAVWNQMKDMGLTTGQRFAEYVSKQDPDLSLPKVISVLQGIVVHFNPDRYVDNWHPEALRLSKVLGCHVSRLFPIPEDWTGPRMATPERRKYLQYREKILTEAKKNGFSTLRELSEFVGVTHTRMHEILRRGGVYREKTGEWHNIAKKVSEALCMSPEQLFGKPEGLKEARRHWELAAYTAPALAPDSIDPHRNTNCGVDLDRDHDLHRVRRDMGKSLLGLSPREHFVLAMRYGLGGLEVESTLDEVGNEIHLTRERVRQIEAKAIRKLRHPSRSRELAQYMDVFEP